MSKVEILEDVSDSEVQKVVENFKRAGAQVSTTRQDNGLWKVVATFPDK
ncbi:MAG: hypothetical protein AB1480_05290 [Nitrospirota bacterium]